MKLFKKIMLAILALLLLVTIGYTIDYLRPSTRMHRHHEKGMLYLKKQKLTKAAEQFQAALAIAPDNVAIRLQLAFCYVAQKRHNRAIKELKQILAARPKNTKACMTLVNVYLRTGQQQKAMEVTDAFLQLQEHEDLATIRAGVLFRKREFEKAEQEFIKILKHNPNNFIARLQLGNIYLFTDRKKQAVAELSKLYQQYPQSLAAVSSSLALALLDTGDREQAVALAIKAIGQGALPQKYPFLYYVRGVGALANKKYADALNDFRQVKFLTKQVPSFAYHLAQAYLGVADVDSAIAVLMDSAANFPHKLPSRKLLIKLLIKQGKLDDALQHCNTLLQHHPKNLAILNHKATILHAQDQVDARDEVLQKIRQLTPKANREVVELLITLSRQDAPKALEKLLAIREKHPDNPDINYLLAKVYGNLGNWEKALHSLQQVFLQAAEHVPALILRAKIRRFQGLFHLAIADFTKVLQKAPQNWQARKQLFDLYLRTGQHQVAMEILQQSGIAQANPKLFLLWRAKIYFAARKYGEALESAKQIAPATLESLMFQGAVYQRIGNFANAVQVYQQADQLETASQAQLFLAICHLLQQQRPQAIFALEQYRQQFPEDYVARILLAILFNGRSQRERALKQLEYVLQNRNRHQWLAHILQSVIYQDQLQYQKAQANLAKIPGWQQKWHDSFTQLLIFGQKEAIPYSLLLEVVALVEMELLHDAVRQCDFALQALAAREQKSLQLLPAGIRYLQQLLQTTKAATMANLGQQQMAIDLLADSLQQHQQDAYVHAHLGKLLMKKGMHKKAVSHFEKAVALKPDFIEMLTLLGTYSIRLKKFDSAIAHYRKAIDIHENNPSAMLPFKTYNNLAALYLMKSPPNPQLAIKYGKIAFQYLPYRGDIADTLGWAYFHAGDYVQAIRFLEYAVNLLPQHPTLSYHLGAAYARQKRYRDARFFLQKALKLSSKFAEVQQTRELLRKIAKR